MVGRKEVILKKKFYFSFICKIPIELNNPKASTGTHAAKDNEILFV